MMDIMEKSSDIGQIKTSRSKKAKVLKTLEVGTPVTVY